MRSFVSVQDDKLGSKNLGSYLIKNMKNILITRSPNHCKKLVAKFSAQRFRVFCEPLFEVENITLEKITKPTAAVIITSSNAISALLDSALNKTTKIFTVGPNTATKLRKCGFENIVTSPNFSAESLFELVKEETGPILYFRGSIISFDFAAKLKNIHEIIAYKIHELEKFSPDFKKIPYDKVLIFSKNSCEIFNKLIRRHNLLEYFANAQILCPSQQILEKAKELGFNRVLKMDFLQND